MRFAIPGEGHDIGIRDANHFARIPSRDVDDPQLVVGPIRQATAIWRNHASSVVRNVKDEQGLGVALAAHRVSDEEAEAVVEDSRRAGGRADRDYSRGSTTTRCGKEKRHDRLNHTARPHSHDPTNEPKSRLVTVPPFAG